MTNITVLDQVGRTLNYDLINFPSGEFQVRYDLTNLLKGSSVYYFHATIRSMDDLMILAQLKESLTPLYGAPCFLILKYLPFTRQDRVCNHGECTSITLFANFLNTLNFTNVSIIHPHSDVTPAVINNSTVADPLTLVELSKEYADIFDEYDALVAPDYGASKMVKGLCSNFNLDFVQGIKKRDTATGELSGFDYQADFDIRGKRLLMVDDLCDGGGTFIGLEKELRKGSPLYTSLLVTHGLFTKGTKLLTDVFWDVYTTDSYYIEDESDTVKVINLPQ